MAYDVPPPQLAPTPEVVAFLHEILRQLDQTGRDKQRVFAFFKAHLDALNNGHLLSAIPPVFTETTQSTQYQKIASGKGNSCHGQL